MRYKYLYADKWLDTNPDKLFSDILDGNKLLFNKAKYPEDYRDAIYKKNESFKKDMKEDPLFDGFLNIIITNSNPNRGFNV